MLLRAVAERQRWRSQYDQAKTAAGAVDSRSATGSDPPTPEAATARPHPMTGPHLVGGAGVKGERSESRSDGVAALDGRDGDQTLQAG